MLLIKEVHINIRNQKIGHAKKVQFLYFKNFI